MFFKEEDKKEKNEKREGERVRSFRSSGFLLVYRMIASLQTAQVKLARMLLLVLGDNRETPT